MSLTSLLPSFVAFVARATHATHKQLGTLIRSLARLPLVAIVEAIANFKNRGQSALFWARRFGKSTLTPVSMNFDAASGVWQFRFDRGEGTNPATLEISLDESTGAAKLGSEFTFFEAAALESRL